MTDDKWQEIVEMAKKNFRGVKLSSEDLILQKEEGPEKQGTQDILEFEHPNGDRYKLVRENRPVVLEKKELYSHRAGQSAQAQYKFSTTEFSHKLKVYKEVDFEWEEITLNSLGL
jgi:hypothetical protein